MHCHDFIAHFASEGYDPRPDGNGYRAICPAHNGGDRNLKISEGADGRILLKCHSHDCSAEEITSAVGLEVHDLYPERTHASDTASDQRSCHRTFASGNVDTHAVYVELLSRLGFQHDHYRNLAEKRKLGHDVAMNFRSERGYASLGKNRRSVAAQIAEAFPSYDLGAVPGLVQKDGAWTIAGWSGLLIPIRDQNGRIISVTNRLDDDSEAAKGGRYRYLSSSSKGGPSATPAVHHPIFDGSRDTIRVTEGPLKGDVATELTGILTLAIPGVGSWRLGVDAIERLRPTRVLIAMDADLRTNPAVATAVISVTRAVQELGIHVGIETWDLSDGKGIDDLLVGGGSPDVVDDPQQINELLGQLESVRSQPAAWGPIDRLEKVGLPEFPVEALPPSLGEYVAALSHATQTPPDLAAMLCLSVAGAMIARRITVAARDGWTEPTNLFTTVLLPPGNRKSAVFSEVTRPLRELESEHIEASRKVVARDQSERRQLQQQLAKLEKIAGEREDIEASLKASALAEALAERPVLVLPRWLVDDCTCEKLGALLAEQDGRIASLSPEGGVFDLMAGQYSKSGTAQFGVYLLGHSGDDLVTDRIGRPSVRVTRPALTCAYAIQPAVIKGLADQAAFRGRGLLARFLYAMPASWVGNRKVATDPVPEVLRVQYTRAIRTLELLPETVFELDGPARDLFIEWEQEIESRLDEGGDLEAIRDWGAKLAGATLRIAGVLHAFQHGIRPTIDAEVIGNAIAIGRFLIPHAERVLQEMGASDRSVIDDAAYILRWIAKTERTRFTKRELHQHGRRRFTQVDELDAPLQELVARAYIRPIEDAKPDGPGRPASPSFEVNPEVLASEKPESCTQILKNTSVVDRVGEF